MTAFDGGRNHDMDEPRPPWPRAAVDAAWFLAAVIAAVVLSEIAAAVLLDEATLAAIGVTP